MKFRVAFFYVRNKIVKELININKSKIGDNEINAVSAKELYSGLGLAMSAWSRWGKSNIESNEFFKENSDWMGFNVVLSGNETKDYYISIEFAKHLAMMAKTEKAHDYRNYFIECENKAMNSNLPSNYIEALSLLIESEKAKESLKLENTKLTTLLDREFGYVSIIRAALYAGVHEKHFDWRVLKTYTIGLGMDVKQAPSPRFGYMNLYPLKAFQACYSDIDFDDLVPETLEDKELLIIK